MNKYRLFTRGMAYWSLQGWLKATLDLKKPIEQLRSSNWNVLCLLVRNWLIQIKVTTENLLKRGRSMQLYMIWWRVRLNCTVETVAIFLCRKEFCKLRLAALSVTRISSSQALHQQGCSSTRLTNFRCIRVTTLNWCKGCFPIVTGGQSKHPSLRPPSSNGHRALSRLISPSLPHRNK